MYRWGKRLKENAEGSEKLQQEMKKVLSRNRCKNCLVAIAGEDKFLCTSNLHNCVHFPSSSHKARCTSGKGRLIPSCRSFPHPLRLKILTVSWVPKSQIKRNIVSGQHTVLCIQCLKKFNITGRSC